MRLTLLAHGRQRRHQHPGAGMRFTLLALLMPWPVSAQQAPAPSPPWAQTAQGKRDLLASAHNSHQLQEVLTDVLALMQHGSPGAVAAAATRVAAMAADATLPATFRHACLKAGVVQELVRLLGESEGAEAALMALANIATDDPATEADNGFALAVCARGALPPAARLLRAADEPTRQAAAALVAALVESPQCQKMAFGQAFTMTILQCYDCSTITTVVRITLVRPNHLAPSSGRGCSSRCSTSRGMPTTRRGSAPSQLSS